MPAMQLEPPAEPAMTDPFEVADTILVMSRQLTAMLRAGTETIADARDLLHTIREAEGWLSSARSYLDPASTLSR